MATTDFFDATGAQRIRLNNDGDIFEVSGPLDSTDSYSFEHDTDGDELLTVGADTNNYLDDLIGYATYGGVQYPVVHPSGSLAYYITVPEGAASLPEGELATPLTVVTESFPACFTPGTAVTGAGGAASLWNKYHLMTAS